MYPKGTIRVVSIDVCTSFCAKIFVFILFATAKRRRQLTRSARWFSMAFVMLY